MYKNLLILSSIFILLIFSISSCKKDTHQSPVPNIHFLNVNQQNVQQNNVHNEEHFNATQNVNINLLISACWLMSTAQNK